MYNNNTNTIYALSSAPGKAGVSVVRISGSNAKDTFSIFGIDIPTPNQFKLARLTNARTGEAIDNALVTYFKAPRSFTGEDVVELHVHGGNAIKDLIFKILSQQEHFVYAEAGEFTKRAFLNGKLDLLEIEGMADLINAETEFQRKQAFDQMDGKLSNLYNKWKKQIVKNLSYLEATIDFVEEELPDHLLNEQLNEIKTLINELDIHLNDSNKGERLRDGFHIIIAGPPNTGKSSLLNHLSKRDIAIVSSQAGTTRDSIDAYLNIGGFPVVITDTAGIRKGRSSIEDIGIERARTKISEADLVLWLMDSSKKNNQSAPESIKDKVIEVWAKNDISIHKNKEVSISTKYDVGITQLIDIIQKNVEKGCRTEGNFITKSRHRDAIEKVRHYLISSLEHKKNDIELVSEDLRSAINSLGIITGNVDVEDLLDIIFTDFCIGK